MVCEAGYACSGWQSCWGVDEKRDGLAVGEEREGLARDAGEIDVSRLCLLTTGARTWSVWDSGTTTSIGLPSEVVLSLLLLYTLALEVDVVFKSNGLSTGYSVCAEWTGCEVVVGVGDDDDVGGGEMPVCSAILRRCIDEDEGESVVEGGGGVTVVVRGVGEVGGLACDGGGGGGGVDCTHSCTWVAPRDAESLVNTL